MKGENVICFAKDWSEDPTSNHHVMMELARENRVLWLNSLGTRTPSLSSGRDLGRIKRKLTQFWQGPRHVQDGLHVFTPLVVPLPHSSWARAVNRQILRATIRRLRRQLKMDRFQLWTFLPTVADYVGALGEDLVVYYCVDEWSLFSYLDRERTVDAERRLCRRADLVFASCEALAVSKRELNANTYLAPHGVDHALFSRALQPDLPLPEDVARLPRPILGFYGTLQDWVDQGLLVQLARHIPGASVVLLGQQLVDTAELDREPNVYLLGRKPHHDLPAYCKGFDVGLIPYRLDERMPFVNPIKLREYLSAGLPVVSTAVPEVLRYGDHCHVAQDEHAFVAAVKTALRDDSAERRAARSAAMQRETWSEKVKLVGERVERVRRQRGGQA